MARATQYFINYQLFLHEMTKPDVKKMGLLTSPAPLILFIGLSCNSMLHSHHDDCHTHYGGSDDYRRICQKIGGHG